jgi:hypothetical protein
VGVFYLQNPGSAHSLTPKRRNRQDWGPLCYGREILIPQLERVLDEALKRIGAKRKDKKRIAQDLIRSAYVQILNLSYIKKASDKGGIAITKWRKLHKEGKLQDDKPYRGHAKDVRFVVIGWGNKATIADRQRVEDSLLLFVRSTTTWFWPTWDDIENETTIKSSPAGADISKRLREFWTTEPAYPAPLADPIAWRSTGNGWAKP